MDYKPHKRNRSKSLHDPIQDSDDDSSDEFANFQIKTEKVDTSDWPQSDDKILVENVKKESSKDERVRFTTRVLKFDWEKVKFKNYTAEECKNRFLTLLKPLRKHRNLNDVCVELETELEKFSMKKPQTALQIYIKDQLKKADRPFVEIMKNAKQEYNDLPEKTKRKYDELSKAYKKEYLQKRSEYLHDNPTTEFLTAKDKRRIESKKPSTPFMLYYNHNKLTDPDANYHDLREKFPNLPLEVKYSWILKAVKASPDADLNTLLNKEERRIFKGLPKKPPSMYHLYVKDMYSKIKDDYEDTRSALAACASKWKTEDPAVKQKFKAESEKLWIASIREQQALNIKYESEEREEPTESKKKKKKTDESHEDAQNNHVTPEKKKKKKKNKPAISNEVVPTSSDELDTTSIKKEKQSPPAKRPSIFESTDTSNAMTFIHNSTALAKPKKKKKHSSISQEEESEGGSSKPSGNETELLSQSTPTKKRKKEAKQKQSSQPQPPERKPASTVFKYFVEKFDGKKEKAQKAFDKLSKKEKKQLTAEYNAKLSDYVAQLRAYVSSLPKAEAVKYISAVREHRNESEEADSSGTGSKSREDNDNSDSD